jgi:hypothetical protein
MKRWLLKLVLTVGIPITLLPGSAHPGPAPLQLTPERRQLIGVTFDTVGRREVTKRIYTTGPL